MGNKSGRKGKHITHYITACCIIATIAACAPFQNKIAEIQAQQQLEHYREKLADGFFETVIQQGKQVVEENETTPPADIAFYALGEVYAHHDYAGRNFALSQYYFEKLNENFPDSPLTSEAKVYISLFEIIAAKEKAADAMKKSYLQGETPVAETDNNSPITGPRKIVEDKNFEEAVVKNIQVLEKAGNKHPADEALYNLGLIFAHDENPEKDYKKSQIYFYLLTEQFPESELAEEAHIWLGLFQTIEKIQQIDIDIDQQKKQLTR